MYDKKDLLKWYDENYCLKAVKRKGSNIKYVRNQTEEMCLEAIEQEDYLFLYVRNQTKKLCLVMIEKNPESIRFIDIKKFPEIWDRYVLERI